MAGLDWAPCGYESPNYSGLIGLGLKRPCYWMGPLPSAGEDGSPSESLSHIWGVSLSATDRPSSWWWWVTKKAKHQKGRGPAKLEIIKNAEHSVEYKSERSHLLRASLQTLWTNTADSEEFVCKKLGKIYRLFLTTSEPLCSVHKHCRKMACKAENVAKSSRR